MTAPPQHASRAAPGPAIASVSPAPKGLLSRMCACGGAAGASGQCAECRRKRGLGLQPKLRINDPGDAFEREADRVAEAVVSGSLAPADPRGVGPALQRHEPPAGAATTRDAARVARSKAAGTKEPGDISVQRKAAGGSAAGPAEAPPVVHEVLQSPGRPLDAATRTFMESGFGYDFGQVRVHTGPRPSESARSVDARAYTVGRHVVFGEGAYSPATPAGRRLLAHELTHVVQQAGGTGGSPALQAKSRLSTLSAPGRRLQRACNVSAEDLAGCSEGVGVKTIFDVATTSEATVLFDQECELSPGYADAPGRIASALPQNVRVAIHGFSSDEEHADFACHRAVVVRDALLDNGVEADQVAALYHHSAVPGDPVSHRSAVVERVASRVVPAAKSKAKGEPKESVATSEREADVEAAGVSEAVPDAGVPGYRQPGWTAVSKLGIVRVAESGERGARLRPAPSADTADFSPLDENTRVLVTASGPGWVYADVVDKQYGGSSGYIAAHLIWHDLPDPGAVLYHVAKPGLGLQELVENHEQYAGYDIRTGDDARSIVLAVLTANDEDSRTKGHVYLNEAKLAAAKDAGVGTRIADRLDEYRRVTRPILQSVELRHGEKIWLPGKQYVDALKKSGIIPTRPGWKNLAVGLTKGIGGFLAGLVDGFASSIIDVFADIYELVKSIISLVAKLISGEAVRQAEAFYDAVKDMSADELWTMLKDAVVGMVSSIFRDFKTRWTANNTYDAWHFRGSVVGYILAEVLMAIFSFGAATAVKLLGKLGKLGGKLAKILGKVLDRVDDMFDKVPGRKRRSKRDDDDRKAESPEKARQLGPALAAASVTAEAHDAMDSPVDVALASLLLLKRKYSWIRRFEKHKKSPGHWRIVMIGSEHPVDEDYTPAVETSDPTAGPATGTPPPVVRVPRYVEAPGHVMDPQSRALLGDFDRRIAGTGGIERIRASRPAGEGGGLSVVIEGEVRKGMPRRPDPARAGEAVAPNFNASDKLLKNRELGLSDDWERLHLWGPGFGDEAAAGIMRGPKAVNHVWQNRGIEAYVRQLGHLAREQGGRVRVRATAVAWPNPAPSGWTAPAGELFLKRAEYRITVDVPNQRARSITVTLDVAEPPAPKIKTFAIDPPGATNPADAFAPATSKVSGPPTKPRRK